MKRTLILSLAVCALLLAACGQTAEAPLNTEAPPVEVPAETPPAEVPALNAHAAYLFPDAEGFLSPDAPLTAEELARALDLLLPADGDALRAALTDGAEGLSRRDFARRVAEMSGWTAEERLAPDEGALAPVDLDPADPDFALLLEASVPHRADAQGTVWTEAALSTGYAPGVFLRGVELYCCGEDGFLLRDCDLLPLHFGADGRFSSGDEELDGYVSEVLAALIEQYPEDASDRLAMLRHCHEYVRDTFSYLGRRHITDEGVDWSAEEAKLIFSSGKGSCYNYAAAFRALARRLGYPAATVLRSLDAEGNMHAWTDIVIGGVPYVFDPQLESRYYNDRFMLSYQQAAKYGYQRPEPAELLFEPEYRALKYRQPPEQIGEVQAAQTEAGDAFLVYLPYGYDPDGSYRLLLCLGDDPAQVLGEDSADSYDNAVFGCAVNTKYYLDTLIQEGYCAPLIVVAAESGADAGAVLRYTEEHYAVGTARADRAVICAGGADPAALPDSFSCYGVFPGAYHEEETLAALQSRGVIRFLLLAEGEQSDSRTEAEAVYAACAGLESVWDSCLLLVPRTSNARLVFDAALRHLLFYFSPCT